MASQVDSAVIQRTKDTLGKVIKKPPLTDKLLNRPPFRYLHDIISEVSACGSLSNWLVCINSSVGCVGLCVQLTNCSVSANNDLQGRGNVIPIVARHGYTVPSCNWCTLVLCPAMGMDGWAQDEVHQTPRKRRESGDISLTSWVSLSWLLLVTNFQSHCRKHS